jgi:hypothetical protein
MIFKRQSRERLLLHCSLAALLWFHFAALRLFSFSYPMLRRAFRNHPCGAFEALPTVGV